MRLTLALIALALAALPIPAIVADDLFPPTYGRPKVQAIPSVSPEIPPPASVATGSARGGLLAKIRKPVQPEVPPSLPRRVVASPTPTPASATVPVPAPVVARDAPLRRVQATPLDMGLPIVPGAAAPSPAAGSLSLSLQQALTGALTSNPDLVALRTGNPSAASAESVEVARHFPVALNPTVFIDYRPITLIPNGTFGNNGTGGASTGTAAGNSKNGFYHNGQGYLLVAVRQPIEFGHQTTHRHEIAKAAYGVVQWQIVQAELTALVQTYRFFQTAAYRREKLRVAEQLAGFNDNLIASLDRQLQANARTGLAADVAFARVEARASRQAAKAAKQDYITALTDLRNQIGIPETAAESEPLGEFALPGNIPPIDERAMVDAALRCRPDLHAAQSQIAATSAAVRLARGDRIPTAIVGPQYVQDEAGIQYVGFNFVPTLPVLNNGKPLVRQREAEERRAVASYQAAQQRAVAQVRSAVAKWNGASSLVGESDNLTRELGPEVASLERLFEAGQTDLTRVQQARQRMIQLEKAELDALWNATQAQADLMLAVGVPSMIQGMLQDRRGRRGGGISHTREQPHSADAPDPGVGDSRRRSLLRPADCSSPRDAPEPPCPADSPRLRC